MKKVTVLNIYTGETEIVITDAAGINGIVRTGCYDILKVEDTEG